MTDRRTTLLLERLRTLAARKGRFSYDVRGDSHVYSGVAASYGIMEGHTEDVSGLLPVLEHALAHDGIVSGVKDGAEGRTRFTSDRLFTDVGNAVRFAREQQRTSVYNWNRTEEVAVALSGEVNAPSAAPSDK